MKQLLTALFALLWCAHPAWAEPSKQLEITKATLVADHASIVAGQAFEAGILLETKPGWHTYWENPGDAGMTTSEHWTLPEGFTASDIHWPLPKHLSEGPLVTFSYPDAVLLPVTITPPAQLSDKNYTLRVKADWLACKDICIPESAELDISLPIAAKATPSPQAALFTEHHKERAEPYATPLAFQNSDHELVLELPRKALYFDGVQSAFFYPRQQGVFSYGEQRLELTLDALRLHIDKTGNLKDDMSGLLAVTFDNHSEQALDVMLAPEPSTLSVSNAMPTPILPLILLSALVGGLILNLMPCVLPVLSLKALAIAKKSNAERKKTVQLGIAYTLGILLSFALLAGVLIGLQHAGEAVGWGYQMQSPAFVGFLIYLLFLVGLNLSGLFELPVLLGGVGGELASESSWRGSFATGVLATAVATPCTAPFMASAIGVALTLPAWQAMLVFQFLGLGLALPFLLISFFPKLLRFLPKPGAWMETFKQILAFPMYASAIWLVWVLSMQAGAGGVAIVLAGLLCIAFIIWMKRLFDNQHLYHALAAVLLVATSVISLRMVSHMEIMATTVPMEEAKYDVETTDYSPQALAMLREEHKPVFIDATAAWCITCQVNKRTAIHTQRVMQLFKERGITLMVADWTRPSADITQFLRSFGRSGVPLYVYYPADGEPVVLPQILTPDIIIQTIH